MIYRCTECNKDYFISDQNHNNENKTGVCINCQNLSTQAEAKKAEKVKPAKAEKQKKINTKKEKSNTENRKIIDLNSEISLSTVLLIISLTLMIIFSQIIPIIREAQTTKDSEIIHQELTMESANQTYDKDESFYYNRELPEGQAIIENNIVVGFQPLNGDVSLPQQIYLPAGVTEIADYAFKNYYGLVSIIFSNDVNKIGKYAFENCYNLEYVAINDKLEIIDDYAFFRLNLKRINLPKKLDYLGVSALNHVKINDVILSKYAKLGSDCLDFTNYEQNDGEAVIINNLFVKAPTNDKIPLHYIIPDDITSIEDYAFYDSNIEYITIPEGVLYIGPRAFMSCKQLKEVSFPESLIAIDTYAFYNCSSLSKIEFNEGLLAIGYNSFSGTNVPVLNVPENTKVIEEP